MKRKLIKQGASGYTITLPVDWVRRHTLGEGAAVDVDFLHEDLLISAGQQEPATVSFTLPSAEETVVRTMIVNAYRAGFDKMLVTFDSERDIIRRVVEHYLIGFDVFDLGKNQYSLEQVSTPDYDNFEGLIRRQFIFIEHLLRLVLTPTDSALNEYVIKTMRYENYLKRCAVKNIFFHQAGPFVWEFLKLQTQIGRECHHLQHALLHEGLKFDAATKKLLEEIIAMLDLLKSLYLSGDFALLASLHEHEKRVVRREGMKTLKKNSVTYYLLRIAKNIYLAGSPLTGMLHVQAMEKREH